MKDRFRFRVWNTRTKKLREVVQITLDARQHGRTSEISNMETCHLVYQPHLVLEQCTGLKDKNGRLIYEGDMFELEEDVADTVREVVWDKDTSSFKVSCRGKEEYNNGLYNEMREYEELLDLSSFLDCACIIGNIHENADLLKEKSEKPIL